MVWAYTLGSVFLISLLSLIGAFTLGLKVEKLNKMVLFLVSFAAGALFGDALIHLIPESFEKIPSHLVTSLCVLAGIFIFFILERFLRWQHCHVPVSREHTHPFTTINLIGGALHNLIDGMIIAASFSISVNIGIATTLAIVLHEIPQEMGHFGILIHGGFSVSRALLFNFLSALTAFLGALLVLLVGAHVQGLLVYLLPITAGGFLYIAGSDLIPELHHGFDLRGWTSFWQLFCMACSIVVMSLLP